VPRVKAKLGLLNIVLLLQFQHDLPVQPHRSVNVQFLISIQIIREFDKLEESFYLRFMQPLLRIYEGRSNGQEIICRNTLNIFVALL
jgi:hypothetical protein